MIYTHRTVPNVYWTWHLFMKDTVFFFKLIMTWLLETFQSQSSAAVFLYVFFLATHHESPLKAVLYGWHSTNLVKATAFMKNISCKHFSINKCSYNVHESNETNIPERSKEHQFKLMPLFSFCHTFFRNISRQFLKQFFEKYFDTTNRGFYSEWNPFTMWELVKALFT